MRLTALVAAAALLLSGCAGAEESAADAEIRSPIAEAMGFDLDQDPAQAEAEFVEQQREVEALVVDCMAAQGFEYEPIDHGAQVFSADPYADLTPQERAAQIGYGYTLYVDEQPQDAEMFEDPNQQRVEAMAPAEQEAYYAVLYGAASEQTFDAEGEPVVEATYTPTGCQNEAYEEVNGGQDAVYRELEEEFQALYEQVEADPRLAEAEARWATCLAAAGFTYASAEDIFVYLEQRMNDDVYLMDGNAVEVEPALDGEDVPIGPGYDEEALEEVRAEEIAIATADTACQDESGLEEVRQTVQVEYEEAFIAENQAVFDRAAAAQEG